jgi:hypothetical protein
MAGRTRDIPMCDRPVAEAVTVDRDGLGPRRLPYCREHAALFKPALLKRHVPYALSAPLPGDTCYAWKDL